MKSLFFIFLLPLFLLGAGPILVDTDGTGQPVLWLDDVIRYNSESTAEGTLGRLSNGEAVALLEELFEDWQEVTLNGVSVVDFTVVQGSGIGAVDVDNIDDHFTYCPPTASCSGESAPFVLGSARSGQSPFIFDDDGTITDLIQGSGAKSSILGFAGPRVTETVGGMVVITEGQAVLNGLFINCPVGAASSDSCNTPEVSLNDFKGVIFHEIGHFLGLDHTQVNLSSVGVSSQLAAIPTMFPLLVDGEAQLSPHYDDIVSLASLYPSSDFNSSFCTMTGTTFRANGTTELQGVNVVARRVSNPLIESTSFVSGQLYISTSSTNCATANGDYTIRGIIPNVEYTLEVEKISSSFTGGSSIEPCDPAQTGFDSDTLDGTFSCTSAGQVVTVGTDSSTNITTTKGATSSGTGGSSASSSSSGCNLIR